MLDEKLKSLFLVGRNNKSVASHKTHKKTISKPFIEASKSRNTASRTQKQVGHDTKSRSKDRNILQIYKIFDTKIERQNSSKQRGIKNSQDRKLRNDSKSKNNRLSLMGIGNHSRNGVQLKTNIKEISKIKVLPQRNRISRGFKRAYVASLLQPSLSMKNN